MKYFLRILLCLVICRPAFPAFSATTHWNMQTTGSDSNGGGFDTSATGTDKSQGAATAFTNLIIGGTTTQGTSATLAFDSTSPGNVLNVTGGVGCTVQRVQISSQSGGTATFDKSLGTGGSTCTGTAYGPLLTASKAAGLLVNSNVVDVKAGTYTVTAAVSTFVSVKQMWIGYGTTPGDAGTKPLFTSATNSVNIFNPPLVSDNFVFRNISFSHTAATRGDCYRPSSTTNIITFEDVTFDGCAVAINGDNGGGTGAISQLILKNVEIKNSVSDGVRTWNGPSIIGPGTWIHNNGRDGWRTVTNGPNIICTHAVISSNTGSGISMQGTGTVYALSCNFVSNTLDGITFVNQLQPNYFAVNSIFYGNGRYGLNVATAIQSDYGFSNAYGANSTANFNNTIAGIGDIALSANPFVSSTNFALNTTVGGGALLTGLGYPGVFGGGTTTGFADVGAVQGGSGHCPACPACASRSFACAQ